jgi:tRNA-2-methylthio-N6-dimethylallyladenosine synthase
MTNDTQQIVSAGRKHGLRTYIETYGCQMNVADSELVRGILGRAGMTFVDRPDDADVILLNTCAVREHAETRVIGRLGELTKFRHRNPDIFMGVLGCMAKHLRERIFKAAPVVDLVAGPDSYRDLPELIARARSTSVVDVGFRKTELYEGLEPEPGDGITGWVTIMRGCDRFCTYCIVPYVRGREKSVSPDEVMKQVRFLAERGFCEVCLLGQTVNSYACGDVDFADLLRMVAGVDGIERIRFTSPHPAEFTESVIEAIGTTEKVCPHMHLPVQSGSDRMLEIMQRDYTSGEYLTLVEQLRSTRPDISLTTDIIAGFCTETEEDHRATIDLLKTIEFDAAFMFRYSPREGTVAHRTLPDDVSDELKIERLQEIIELQESISARAYAAQVGKTATVLVEGPARKPEGNNYGRTPQFHGVVFPGSFPANTFVDVEITDSTPHTLRGKALDGSRE